MKRFLLLITFIAPLFLNAQNIEGEIRYNQNIKLNIEFPEGHEDLAKMMPSSQSFEKILFLKGDESLYRDTNEDDDSGDTLEAEEETEDGTVRMKMIIQRPENKLYKNQANGKVVDSRDFMGRKFLIDGKIKEYEWKLTGEQEEILGYACQKATFQKEDDTIEAWFTMQIPVSNGPDNYGQLPGLILKVVSDNGDREIVATKITLETIAEDAIEIPTKGKKVSQEEYDEIVEKKTKEMEEENGGNGTFQIKIRNN